MVKDSSSKIFAMTKLACLHWEQEPCCDEADDCQSKQPKQQHKLPFQITAQRCLTLVAIAMVCVPSPYVCSRHHCLSLPSLHSRDTLSMPFTATRHA